MNYDQFRAAWQEAFEEAGLRRFGFPAETLDLRCMARSYKTYVMLGRPEEPVEFTISAELNWDWSALLSAWSETTEEDMLMQVLGDDDRKTSTEPPQLSVAIGLHAKRPWGKSLPMPSTTAWKRWTAELASRLDVLLPITAVEANGLPIVMSWRGEPEAEVICLASGELVVSGVKLDAWQAIDLPRQWDDPDKESEEGPDEQLADLAGRVAQALQVWEASLRHLRIRRS